VKSPNDHHENRHNKAVISDWRTEKAKNGGKGQRNSLYKFSGDVRYRSLVGGEFGSIDLCYL